MKIRQRHEDDPVFRQLVNMMCAAIEQGQFTPTEVREAAMLAQIKYEETHIRPMTFTRNDILHGKV